MKPIMLLLVATAVVIATATSASAADPPTHATHHYEYDYIIPGAGNVCAFAVRNQSTVDQRETIFADGSFFNESKSSEVLTNLRSGRQIFVTASYTAHVDPSIPEGRITGMIEQIRDAQGHLIYSTAAGQNVTVDYAEVKQTPNTHWFDLRICDALAQ